MGQDEIVVFLAYILPGFIIFNMTRNVFRIKESDISKQIYYYILFSLLNLYVVQLVSLVLRLSPFYIINSIPFYFRSIISSIVIPIILAILIIEISLIMWKPNNFKCFKKLLNRWGIGFFTRGNSAWDQLFSRIQEERGAKVTVLLSDGSVVYGLIGGKSFASFLSTDDRNSLILEKTYYDERCEIGQENAMLIESCNIISIKLHNSILKGE